MGESKMAEEITSNDELLAEDAKVELSDKDKDFCKRFNLRPEHLQYKKLAEEQSENK